MTPNRAERKPPGLTALGVFFYFGAIMSSYAALTLGKPGTFLDRLWLLNRNAHIQLAALGPVAAIPVTVLALVCF